MAEPLMTDDGEVVPGWWSGTRRPALAAVAGRPRQPRMPHGIAGPLALLSIAMTRHYRARTG